MSARTGDAHAGDAHPGSRPAADPSTILMMGNEAIARGALEGGVSFCAGYPGNPSSEIIDTLSAWARGPGVGGRRLHVEWSVNEMVAAEAAAGAAVVGLGALVAMKQNGLNVCADFFTTLNLTGVGSGGLVVVVCDDPGPLTSTNDEDSRFYAKLFMLPLLEPATPQEAKDMTHAALDLSRRESLPVLVRSVSRVSHCRAAVTVGSVPFEIPPPHFDRGRPLLGLPQLVTANHRALQARLNGMQVRREGEAFNLYLGPERSELLVVASGLAALYAEEAVVSLGVAERVGVLRLGMVWPFPVDLVGYHLARARQVLVAEQIEPFVEEQVRLVHSHLAGELGGLSIFGKGSGHLQAAGELDREAVAGAIAELLDLSDRPDTSSSLEAWRIRANEALAGLPPREISFCFGCPHRASFWAINCAMALDGREGVVLGDIGCYGLAAGPTGFSQLKTLHCMGAGVGMGNGLGVLRELGFDQPVLAVAGDSTFYHACLPALVNARQQRADLTLVLVDNSTTAMTGFQPHPGSPAGKDDPAWVSLPPEDVCRGMGIDVEVLDPVDDVRAATEVVFRSLRSRGLKVLVFRRACATWEARLGRGSNRAAAVDAAACLADECGCDRFCVRVLGCPGNRWDPVAGKAYVDPDYCNGCGLCVQLCPAGALSVDGGPSA